MGSEAATVVTSPQLLAIGHVSWDVLPPNLAIREPGGAVAFAAITATNLGVRPAIVTACGDDYPIDTIVDDPDRIVRIPSHQTSTFENHYDHRGDRIQLLHRRADEIYVDHVPTSWRNPELLFVGPLTQELPIDCLSWFKPRLSCLVPQGWLRNWDEPLPSAINVSTQPPRGISRGWDICVLSESEIQPESIDRWRKVSHHLVITKGRDGAALYSPGRPDPVLIPSFAQKVDGAGADTTGAGDVFAASMLIRYAATCDAFASAMYASICAALSTRAPSWDAIEAPSVFFVDSVTGSGGTEGNDQSPTNRHMH